MPRPISRARYRRDHRLTLAPSLFLLHRSVAKIEQIDEVEELNLVLEHYAVTWGSLGSGDEVVGLKMR